MSSKIDWTLCLVTDRDMMATQSSIEECVEQAILGGCGIVQLREKTACAREFYEIALRLRALTGRLGAALVINDRADIALACGADGVHVGQGDLPCRAAISVLGPGKIVGVSASTVAEAIVARHAGASYVGAGAIFPTATKPDAEISGLERLRKMRAAVDIPIIAIGGIAPANAAGLGETGIDGIAVVSAIAARGDPADAARELKALFLQGLAQARASKP